MDAEYLVEPLDESGGHCDCCGNTSRTVWGLVHLGENTVAAYWMHWTIEHLNESGANLDIIIGTWGDEASASDRSAISLVHREQHERPAELMVIDAVDRPIAQSELARHALCRDEVIGTPLAQVIFGIVDAIYEQDSRFF